MNKKSCFLLVWMSFLLMIIAIEVSLLPWRLLSLTGKGLRFILVISRSRKGEKKMRLNGLIGFVLASFVCIGTGGLSHAEVVTGANQPNATLAPQGAMVEFTNFTVRPGRKELEIKTIKIKKGGFGNISAMTDVYIVAEKSPGVSQGNQGRIVMSSPVVNITILDDDDSVELELINLPEDGGLPTFTKPVKLSVFAKMGTSLGEFAGQVIYLRVESIIAINKKTGKEIELKGNFPIVGAGHTVNASLQIGSLEVNVDDPLELIAGIEPIRLSKLVMRATPLEIEDDSDQSSDQSENSYFLYVEKYRSYEFKREENLIYVDFKEEILIEKGETLTLEFRSGEKNSRWELLSFYLEDIEVYGDVYGYRVLPVDIESTEDCGEV